jgi:hypothetical protein
MNYAKLHNALYLASLKKYKAELATDFSFQALLRITVFQEAGR